MGYHSSSNVEILFYYYDIVDNYPIVNNEDLANVLFMNDNNDWYHSLLLKEQNSDGFMLDGFDFTFMSDDVLFSMNDDTSIKGIQLNGWLMNVYGSMHSNSNIEVNSSVITVGGDCSSVNGIQFNTWQTLIENETITSEFVDFPDVLSVIKSRL